MLSTHRILCSATLAGLLAAPPAAAPPAAASPAAAPSAAAPLTAAVSVPPHAWLVERLAGDRVEVLTLVPPGQSPETYQPTDAQVSRAMRARVLFRAGVPMEAAPWFGALARRVEVVDLRRGVPLRRLEEEDGDAASSGRPHGHAGEDPHTWLSPRVLARQAATVPAALAALDPVHRDAYEAGRARVEAALAALDRELAERLRPLAGGSFVVFHPAWGYFADAYALTQVAIEREGKDPSDRELTALQVRARRAGARVIFVQPQIPGRSAEAVARAVGARLERLDPLAYDVPDNLRRVAARLLAAAGVGGEGPAEGAP